MAIDAIYFLCHNMSYMGAELIIHEKLVLDENSLIEIRIWRVPKPVKASTHNLKYSAVYIENNSRIVGYDNEQGKGDHCHYRDRELPYKFKSIEQLLADFRSYIEKIRGKKI